MKYQGSKQRILNGILPLLIPEIYNKSAFVDAFCGGCSVVENMPKDVRRIANDKNKYLIAMWKSLTNDRCRKPPMRIERDFYCVWSKEITNSMHQKNTYKPVEKLFML